MKSFQFRQQLIRRKHFKENIWYRFPKGTGNIALLYYYCYYFFGRGGGGEGGLRWGGQVSGASFSPLSCACHSFLFLFWLAMAWARNQNFKTRTWSVDSTYRVFPWLAPLARYFLKQWAMFDISTFLHGSEALQSFKAFIISQFQKETRKQRNHH